MNRTAVFHIFSVALVLSTFLTAILSSAASASTEVSGPITTDTTWTKVNSPYIVTGSVLVQEGVTLTIEPGVEVKFDSAKGLQVEGQLIAQGTETERIVFTSNQPTPAPGDWVNILFTDTSVDATYDGEGNYINGSIMQYCTVEYGGGTGLPMLKMASSSPFIDHCTATHSASGGIQIDEGSIKICNSTISNNSASSNGGGIYAAASTLTVSNCTISNNNSAKWGGGIYIGLGALTIVNCTITNNSATVSGGGICTENSNVLNIANSTITDNVSTNASTTGAAGGVQASTYILTISNSTINNNKADSSFGGIYVNAHTATLSNSTISSNSATKGDGGGLYIFVWGLTPTIAKCVITNNSAGGDGGGIYSLSNLYISTLGIGNCTITGNSAAGKGGGIHVNAQAALNYNNIHANTPYDVYYSNVQGSPHVNATNNWWGTVDEASIRAHIYDFYDDASLGIVDYIPYLTFPHTGIPITGITGEVNCDILPFAYVELSQGATVVDSTTSDAAGNYLLTALAPGTYDIVVDKDGRRPQTQQVTISGPDPVILDFIGQTGLIPNAPSVQYVAQCSNHYLYPYGNCGLTVQRVAAVSNAYLYPVSE
jgi:parallel beta-helix repeat protein/predicted outer membrane repeat protein